MSSLIQKVFRRFASTHTPVCVVGGGAAGINFASHFRKSTKEAIRVFEPSPIHYYYSGYTMLASGLCNNSTVFKNNADIFPKELHLTQKSVSRIQPSKNTLYTADNEQYTYDQLLVATGCQDGWHLVKGAKEALDDPDCPVSSVYSYEYALKTKRVADSFKGGNAIFTQAEAPVKCGVASQMIMYLLADKWLKTKSVEIVKFRTPEQNLFRVPKYDESLKKISKGYGIDINYGERLVEIKKDERIAVFENLASKERREEHFDFLHICPTIVPPKLIAESGLGDAWGFCEVDEHTLQHKTFPNVWSLGDCSNLPCEKTAAAIYTQTDVLLKNMKQQMLNQKPISLYDGYSSCPIFVGNKKVILAEFKYNDIVDESFSTDQQIPSSFFYALTKQFFPFAYWRWVPKGLWLGKDGLRTW